MKPTPLMPTRGMRVQNDNTATIPPRSIVVVTSVETSASTDTQESETVTHVDKFDGARKGNIMVTGAAPIAPDGQGQAFYDSCLFIAIDQSIDPPKAGDQWGPIPNQWYISKSGTGFFAHGHPESNGDAGKSIFYRLRPAAGVYVVTETTINAQVGGGENIDIGQSFLQNTDSGLAVFNCKPLKTQSSWITDLDGDPILCAARFINGSLFTGQQFLAAPASLTDKIGGVGKYSIDLDYVSGADNSRWTGRINGAGGGTSVSVDIDINPILSNRSTTRGQTCRVTAQNLPAVVYQDRQAVYLERLANKVTPGSSAWIIVDYVCQ